MRRSASPRRALLAGVMALVALATSGTARAEARSISIAGVACPAPGAVVAALAEVLVHTDVRQVDGPADIVIEATDADVRITAFGTTKRFSGSCDERVRLLSAYVALGLEPPMPMAPVEPPAERPVAPPVRPLPRPEQRDPKRQPGGPGGGPDAFVSASVGALGIPGTAGHGGAVTPVLGLRGALGVAPLAVTLGASLVFPYAVATRGPNVTISRQAIDLGLRIAYPIGRVTLAAEGGPVLARTVVVAEGLANAEPSTSRAELGLRLGAEVGLRLAARLSATVTLEGYGVPAPATLALRSTGDVGTMPAFALGGMFGLRYQLAGPFP